MDSAFSGVIFVSAMVDIAEEVIGFASSEVDEDKICSLVALSVKDKEDIGRSLVTKSEVFEEKEHGISVGESSEGTSEIDDGDIQTELVRSSTIVFIVLVSNKDNSVLISLVKSLALTISAVSVIPL